MRQRGIAFLLVSAMVLNPLFGVVCHAQPADGTGAILQESVSSDEVLEKSPDEALEEESLPALVEIGEIGENKADPQEEGLTTSEDIEWNDDGEPYLREDAEYHGADWEIRADILWGATCAVRNNGSPVSPEALHIYRLDESSGRYVAEDTASVSVCEANRDLILFSFEKCGRYHISTAENGEHADPEEETEGDDCIKFQVNYPDIAFYKTAELSEEGIIKGDEVRYDAGDIWYIITNKAEWNSITDVALEVMDVPEAIFGIEEVEKNRKYKITANAAASAVAGDGIYRGRLRARCSVSDINSPEETWYSEQEMFFVQTDADDKKGLLATEWRYWDEDEEREAVDDDLCGFGNILYTALESSLCFKYNDGTKLTTDEEGVTRLGADPIPAEAVRIYVTGRGGRLTEASSDLVSYRQNEEIPGLIDFSFKRCTQCIVEYQTETGENARMVVCAGYPTVAFYTGQDCTEDGLIRGEWTYSWNKRVFYLVLNQYENGEGENYPVISEAPVFETNGKAKVEKQSDAVYKITVNPGVKEEFEVSAALKLRGENPDDSWEEAPAIRLSYKAAPEITSFNVEPKNIEMEIGKTAQLKASVNSEDGTAAVTYKSADSSVASVDANGKVTGVKAGKTEIVVTAALEKSVRSQKVTVVVKENRKEKLPVQGSKVKAEDKSTVSTAEDGTAAINTAAAKKKAKSVKVPGTVVVDGVEYTVTRVGANAFKSVAKTVASITLPDTITRLDKNSFKGLKKLKKITMKVKTPVTVSKGAFKGVDTKKVTIIVSRKMKPEDLKKFKKALKKAGYKGSVKAK